MIRVWSGGITRASRTISGETDVPVQKLRLVSKYFRDYTFTSCKVLDIGVILGYRHLLERIFQSATVYILNADDNVKSTPSVLARR